MIQRPRKEVFGHFLEFGLLDRLDIAYYDSTKCFSTFGNGNRSCIIKVRFKMSETNCKILNIFANSHVIQKISIVMDSKYYVDNFQPVFIAKTAKFHMKKQGGKFDDF